MAEMVAKLEDVLHRLFRNIRDQERVGVGSLALSLPSQTLIRAMKIQLVGTEYDPQFEK